MKIYVIFLKKSLQEGTKGLFRGKKGAFNKDFIRNLAGNL